LPVVLPACRSFFHIVLVQFKISLKEMLHICRRLGADRPPLWRSPAWELQVVRRQLCTSTVISDARTASAFLSGHCLDARSSHYICSSTVTAPHHFRPPDSTIWYLSHIMYQMMEMKMNGF
jgi:hypothetical protein